MQKRVNSMLGGVCREPGRAEGSGGAGELLCKIRHVLQPGTRVAWRASFVLGSSDCWDQQDSPHASPKELPLFIVKI